MKSFFLQLLIHILTVAFTLLLTSSKLINQNTKPESSSCSVIIQNVTHDSSILSPGYIGYIEVPATNSQPPHYKDNDVKL